MEHRREATAQAFLDEAVERANDAFLRHADSTGHAGERRGLELDVLLELAEDGDLLVREVPARGRRRLVSGQRRLRVHRPCARHVEIDADLEHANRLHQPCLLRAGQRMIGVDVLVERRRRRNRDRPPDVELVVASVVVRHAGMVADHSGDVVDAIGRGSRGDER